MITLDYELEKRLRQVAQRHGINADELSDRLMNGALAQFDLLTVAVLMARVHGSQADQDFSDDADGALPNTLWP